MKRPDRPLRHTWVDSPASIRAEWEALAERSGNVFATPEWHEIWWKHFGAERTRRIAVLREPEGTLVGLVPLYSARSRPLHIVRFVGHGAGDQLGPVVAPADRARVAAELPSVLSSFRWTVLLAEQLAGDEGWADALGGTRLRREGNVVVPLAGRTWDELFAGLSSNLRPKLRRGRRQLDALGATYRLADDPERLHADLDDLLRLHAHWWDESSSPFLRDEAFHREFAAVALDRGWLRLWFIDVEGAPVAAWYGLRFAGSDAFYQSGRDPEYGRYGIGMVLLTHVMRDALEHGLDEFRFLRGDERYKYRFSTDDRGLETVVLGRGAVGRVAVAALEARERRRAQATEGQATPEA